MANKPQHACFGCRRHPSTPKRYGLCNECFKDDALREHYKERYSRSKEMSEAQLDAMIAKQMRCKPAWWDAESRKVQEGRDGI